MDELSSGTLSFPAGDPGPRWCRCRLPTNGSPPAAPAGPPSDCPAPRHIPPGSLAQAPKSQDEPCAHPIRRWHPQRLTVRVRQCQSREPTPRSTRATQHHLAQITIAIGAVAGRQGPVRPGMILPPRRRRAAGQANQHQCQHKNPLHIRRPIQSLTNGVPEPGLLANSVLNQRNVPTYPSPPGMLCCTPSRAEAAPRGEPR
jgi:hypothetical protein